MAAVLIPKQARNLLAVSPAESKFRAILQQHDIFAVESGAEFLNAIRVDHRRAMDAEEAMGIEPLL